MPGSQLEKIVCEMRDAFLRNKSILSNCSCLQPISARTCLQPWPPCFTPALHYFPANRASSTQPQSSSDMHSYICTHNFTVRDAQFLFVPQMFHSLQLLSNPPCPSFHIKQKPVLALSSRANSLFDDHPIIPYSFPYRIPHHMPTPIR
jgi:hypothetical protein